MRYIAILLFLFINHISPADRLAIDSIIPGKSLDEITVVAEKKAIHPVNMPVAVSVIKNDEIPAKGNIDIRNLSGLIPNFFMLEYGLKLSTPVFIRGIGTPTANPAVGLYVDGVPVFDKNTYIFDLYDIRQIEILRGPQGTLQGRNTLGGMINILTNSPESDFSFSAKAAYSNYNTQNYNLLLNIPIGNYFFNKFFVAYHKTDGFFRNKARNNENVDQSEGYTFRYQGRCLPGRNWDIRYGVNYYNTTDGGYGYYFPDSLRKVHYKVAYNSPSSYKRDLVTSYLNLKKNFNKATFNAVTSYTYYDDKQQTDQDYSDLDIYYNEKPSHQHLLTQEINLQSAHTKHLDWIVGTFGFYKNLTNDLTTNYEKDKYQVRIHLPNGMAIPVLATYLQDLYHNNTITKGIAGYGQFTVKNLLPGLFITAGIRYDIEQNRVRYQDSRVRTNGTTDTLFHDTKTAREWLPKFSILQKWNDRMSSYFTVSKGYKAGGYNIVLNMMRNNLSYESEYTWNYELGYKYVSKSQNFRLNTAVFYIDWTNQQLFQMEMNAALIKNGGDAYSTGAEMDVQWRFHKNFTYNLAFGYTHAEYADYTGTDAMTHKPYNYNNNYLPMVPEFTFNTGVIYNKNITTRWLRSITASTNVTGIGKQYFDDSNDKALKENAYFLWNASCLFSTKHIDIELWGKNILDTHYFANMLASPMSVVSDDMKYLGQSGSPATFGASVSLNF